MKCAIPFVFCFLLCAGVDARMPGFANPALQGFKKASENSWSGQKNNQHVVTVQTLHDAWFDLDQEGTDSYVRKLEEIRGTINFFAGISGWVVTKHSSAKQGNRVFLNLQGQYQINDQVVYFSERQIFLKPNIYQVTISSNRFSDIDEKETEKIFSQFMREIH